MVSPRRGVRPKAPLEVAAKQQSARQKRANLQLEGASTTKPQSCQSSLPATMPPTRPPPETQILHPSLFHVRACHLLSRATCRIAIFHLRMPPVKTTLLLLPLDTHPLLTRTPSHTQASHHITLAQRLLLLTAAMRTSIHTLTLEMPPQSQASAQPAIALPDLSTMAASAVPTTPRVPATIRLTRIHLDTTPLQHLFLRTDSAPRRSIAAAAAVSASFVHLLVPPTADCRLLTSRRPAPPIDPLRLRTTMVDCRPPQTRTSRLFRLVRAQIVLHSMTPDRTHVHRRTPLQLRSREAQLSLRAEQPQRPACMTLTGQLEMLRATAMGPCSATIFPTHRSWGRAGRTQYSRILIRPKRQPKLTKRPWEDQQAFGSHTPARAISCWWEERFGNYNATEIVTELTGRGKRSVSIRMTRPKTSIWNRFSGSSQETRADTA